MKRQIYLAVLLIVLCSFSNWAQNKKNVKYTFPKKSVEFVVTFPAKPKLKKISAKGVSGTSAKLVLADEIIKADVTEISEAVSAKIERFSETELASAARNHGRDNGYEDLTVTTDKTDIGRYARMQGYKTISDVRVMYEAHFYYGKRQVLILYVISESSEYPTKAISKFLNSLSIVKENK